jgi:Uma2 family endonuclease
MRNVELSFQLRSWERRTKHGPTFDSSTGFRLPDTSVFSPDGAFVRAERWQPLSRPQRERCFDGAPDAAFEIVSRTDLRTAQLMKCDAYVRPSCRSSSWTPTRFSTPDPPRCHPELVEG